MDLETSIIDKLTSFRELKIAMDSGLRVQHFYDPLHQGCFTFIANYWESSHHQAAPTTDAVSYEFPTYSFTGKVEETTEWLVEKLKLRYVRNELQTSMLEVAEMANRNDQPMEALRKINADSWAAMRVSTPRQGRADLSQDVDVRRLRYADRASFDGTVAGAPIGLEAVDNHTFGILPGELALLVAFSKKGKSFLLAHAAICARRAGYTPYLATLELSINDFEDRLDAMCSGLSYEKIQKGKLNDDESKELAEHQEKLAALGSLFVEKPPRGERTVQYLVNRAWDCGANFLLIDQLSFLEGSDTKGYRDNHLRVSDIVNDLKLEISQDDSHAMPTFMAAQMNREGNKEKKPQLHHIALSSALEQTCDLAYGLSQSEEMKANNTMQLDQLGFRRGEAKSWLLEWNLRNQTKIGVRQEVPQDG